ncbi:hypothetical protein PAAG_11129 [Paracoccidioides lutzii Pb01]|uniref:Uncharacterized protein n=1 Tax=Paracoccidioides lutzii (strain ATCC MYA-826 / Pb01) TaxID=502779 RepID=A0A0A2VMY2_PARBA|nr:hypothetical protein PAAG_11129 [Paracoccidioides lutzii Pb01]KGQ02174.1 hypothetical protein PAAG_11129 [Paracoccidioides lutzii Pb01]
MYKPSSQEEMDYISKRFEEYTDRVRRQTHILDNFDNAVILADARTLFSYIALLESTIKTQRVKVAPQTYTKCVNQHIMILDRDAIQEENHAIGWACRPGELWKAAATFLKYTATRDGSLKGRCR